MKSLIEACLIVRDEENHLGPCLEALAECRPLVGAINVYDTGSTDGTVSLASARGCRVRRGTWRGDFSAARNASIEMARAPWVLRVDADERVLADIDALGRILRSSPTVDVFNATWDHVDERGSVIGRSEYAAVINRSTTCYVGRIHEVPRRLDGEPVRVATLGEEVLRFRHGGYATPAVRAAKAARNARIAEDDVRASREAGDPQRIAEALYHHARSVAATEAGAPLAVGQLEEAWGMFAPESVGRERVMAELVPLLLRARGLESAFAAVKRHLAAGGSRLHGRVLLATLALAAGDAERALTALDVISEIEDPVADVRMQDVLALRVRACDQAGRPDDALAWCLLLVARWGELAQVRNLVTRVSIEQAPRVAALLSGPDRRVPLEDLAQALIGTAHPTGRAIAASLT